MSPRTHAELASIQKAEYLDLVFSNIDENILLMSLSGEILMFNNAWKEFIVQLTGREPSAGEMIFEVMPKPHDNLNAIIDKCRSGLPFEFDAHFALGGKSVIHHLKHLPVVRNGSTSHMMISGKDVTEQRLTESRLIEKEQNLQTIFQSTSEVFLLMDKEFRIKLFNQPFITTWLKATNARLQSSGSDLLPSEIIGRSIFDFMEAPKREEALERKKILETTGKVNYIKKIGAGSNARWFDLTIRRIDRTDGDFCYCLSVVDQTPAYLAKELLEQSEQRFRSLVENSRDVSLVIDQHGICVYASPNIRQILGYEPSEVIGQRPITLIHPSDVAQLRKDMEEASVQPEGYAHPVLRRARHKNGTFRYMEGVGINLFEAPGIWGRLLVIRDVTERIQRDEQLHKLNKSLSEFQRAINGASIVSKTDPLGRITFVNENFINKSGYSRDELIGNNHKLISSGHHPEEFWKDMWQTISKGQIWRNEVKNLAKDGSFFWVDTFIAPLFDDDGRIREYLTIRNDVTEQKIIEEITHRYNERFELVSKATNEAIWDWDIEHNVETWNHGLKTIFGYDAQTITEPDQWWKDKIHPEDYPKIKHTIDQCFTYHKEHWSFSYRYKCADGSYKNVLDRAYIVYKNDLPVRMIGAIQDVTRETQSISEIERLSLVARYTSDAVIIANSRNEIEWTNSSFRSLTGRDPLDVLGQNPLSVLIDESTDPAVAARIRDLIGAQGYIDQEAVGLNKDGQQFWQQLTVKTIVDEKHVPRQFIYIAHDITDRKKFEASITATAQELKGLIENANVPILGIDKNGLVRSWNKVASDVTGYSWDEITGNHIGKLLNRKDRLKLSRTLREVLDGKAISNYELKILNKQGLVVELFAAITRTIDVNGVITGFTIVAQDLTELLRYRNDLESLVKQRTDELHQALKQEKEMVEMKSRFVSVASHEFRTPLTSINIATSTLRKFRSKMSSKDIEEKLSVIEKQVKHMSWLLDDVLMVGKVESGRLKVSKTSIDIRQFISKIVDEVEGSSRGSHRIKMHFDMSETSMDGDEKLMRNILINLLTNAIKFSPGRQTVSLEVISNNTGLHLKVSDNGIGIPKNEIPNLFNSFQRGSNVDHIEGTGLGLSIVKKAVELLDGSISVESEVGRGTSFLVSIPLRTHSLNHQ